MNLSVPVFLSALSLALLPGLPVTAQDDAPPSRALIEGCLAQPNRTCALAAALMVTSEEELAISRVDTLLAVADTFQRIGDAERARATLALARQAAEDIGLTIATEQKLAEMVGTLAALGETEDAIAVAESLTDRFERANALGTIALSRAREGDFAGAQSTLDRIAEPLLALKYAVEMTEEIAERGDGTDVDAGALEARLERIEHRVLQSLGYSRLAVLLAHRGDLEEARRLRDIAAEAQGYLTSEVDRARFFAGLARADLALGDMAAYQLHITRARSITGRIRAGLDQALAATDVVTALAAGGRIDEAVAVARELEDLRAQSALIRELAGRGAAAPAVTPLAPHILQKAAENDSRHERDRARLAVAGALAEVASVDRAIEVIDTIENDDAQAQALAVLARSLD